MPLDVLGCTRTTMVLTARLTSSPRVSGRLCRQAMGTLPTGAVIGIDVCNCLS